FGFEYWAATELNGTEQYFPGTNLPSGPIPSFTIKDSNECVLTVPQIVVPFASQIDVLVTTDPVRCFDEASGVANISSLAGGTSPYSISWYDSNNTLIASDTYSLNSLAAGDYSIAISDSYECETIVFFTIENKDDIEINASVNNVSCEGFSDGSITTAITGGNGGYSYQWFPGGFINSQISNQSVGNFQLTVSDSEGCTKTEYYIDIENPDDVIIELTSSPITCNGESDGVITANVPFNNVTEYSWYLNGVALSPLVAGNSPVINNTSEGIYNVEVIIDGDNDCPYYSDAIELTQPTAVVATLEFTPPTCSGDNNGTFTAEVEGGTLASGSEYLYRLTDLSDNSIVSILNTFDQLSSGDYLFIAEDDNACSGSVNFTLNDPAAITLNINEINPVCYGVNTGSASFTILNNVGPTYPVWSKIISVGNLNDISFNDSVPNLSAGNYALTVTDSLGCSQYQEFTISQPNPISVTLLPNSSYCANTVEGSVTAQVLNATLPINYLWTINQENNATQSDLSYFTTFSTANDLDVGNITLSGYDQNGCLLPITSVDVQPSSVPLIQAEINILQNNVCNGDSIADLVVNLIYNDNSPVLLTPTYEWYVNGEFIDGSNGGSTNQLINRGPGEYHVIVTDQAYGCVDTAASVTLTDPELMSLNITDFQNVECYGENNGAVSVDIINGVGPNFIYNWNNSMGVSVANDNNNPTNLVAGTYNLVVTDFLIGCTAETTFEITQPDSITFDLFPTHVSCYGLEDGSLIATNVDGGDNNYSYLWTNENNEIISTSNLTDTLSAQLYTVMVSDGVGCSSEDTISILQPEDVAIESNVVNIDCFGDNTGSITITNVSGGTPNYNYIWENNPSTLNTIFNLVAGTYPVNIIDDEECSYYFEIEVEQQAEIEIDAVGTFVSCSEGFANIISINGGVPPYNNYWEEDPTNTTSTISDLTPGNHSFFVTDDLNCIVEDSVLIDGSNDIITNAFVFEEVACHSDSTGSIFVDITSFAAENAPYYYSINDAISFDETVLNNNFYVNDLPIGSYTIFIKDSDDCIDSTTLLTITQPDSLFMTTSSTDIECYGDSAGVITVDISGGVGLYDISIDGGSTFIITNSAGQETILVNAGDYDLFVIDDNDCSVFETITINQPEEFNLTTSNFSDFNGFNTTCYNSNDASFDVGISGGVSPYTLDINGLISSIADGDNIDSLAAGTYTLIITDNNECSIQSEVMITEPNDMVLEYVSSSDFNGQNTSCYNSSDGFVVTKVNGGVGPFDYSLNNGLTYIESNTISQYQFSNLSGGEYIFSVKDDNDCIAELTYTVTSSPEILPLLTLEDEILCNGEGQASLVASVDGGNSPFVYTLTGLVDIETFTSIEGSILIDNLNSGFYELNVTDANGCSNSVASASQIVISEPSSVTYTANVNNISCNNEGNGSVEISGFDGGQSPYNLKFYNAIGVYFEENNLNAFSPALIFESLESESYTLVITDDSGCEFIDTIVIAEPSELMADMDFSEVSCYNGNDASLELSISGGTSPFAITLNEDSYSSDGISTIEDLSAQDYDILIVDASGCEFSASFTISEPDSISIETSVIDNICFGQTNGSIFANVSGGIAPYSYTYTNSNGLIISETNISDNLSDGVYTISVLDSNDCVLVTEIEISEPAEIVVTHEVTDESCAGANNGSIITTVSNSQGSYELFWAVSNMTSIENYGLSPGVYALTVVDSSGCFITDSVTIFAAEEFNVSLEVTNAECRYTNDGQLLIMFDDQESHSVQLSNELVNLQTSGSSEILFEELAEGEYNLQVSYNTTCVLETVVNIEASNGYDCVTPEPTFSPNYDGSNDAFMPLNNFAEVVELTIFNRWGAKIFESQSANPSWDGTNLNGEQVPSADYYYIIKFNNPAYNDITGIITLLK
ncbi:MAG: gliding motility-associated C-terminal domain-containing protein, partial [Flavobacteriales bacterium]|nr:gliding motility-associated C-terminal domain-containing protein [Flavobacteriales bacterium]